MSALLTLRVLRALEPAGFLPAMQLEFPVVLVFDVLPGPIRHLNADGSVLARTRDMNMQGTSSCSWQAGLGTVDKRAMRASVLERSVHNTAMSSNILVE